MPHFNKHNYNGFTLIEVLVAVFGFSFVALGIIALVSNVIRTGSQQGNILADTDQARKVAFQMAQELRNAVTSTTGAYAFDTVEAQQIIFYSNIDGGTEIERVRYYIQNGKVYKGILKPTGSPPAYVGANETTSVVQNALANGSTPLFYYYDGSYNGVTDNPLTQPVTATQVRYVKLNMLITNRAGLKNSGIYTITAGAAVRNLKTNLGS